jgi:glycerol kinase
VPETSTGQVILAIDQGTTNSKAALISADGHLVSGGSAPVGISSPRPGWVEQDANRIWTSVLEAMAGCLEEAPDAEIVGIALSTQRESVVGWRASTGAPLGPVIGWQDRRTASWCSQALSEQDGQLVNARTGLRVDPMFSAPKMRWLLDHLPTGVPIDDVRLGTVDSWLIWQLTGGAEHLCEAGNASRTLLYDITALDWNAELLDVFGVPAASPERRPAGPGRHTGRCGIGRFPRRVVRPGLYRRGHGEGHLRNRVVGHGPGCEPFCRRCTHPGDLGLVDRGVADVCPRGEHPVLRRDAGVGCGAAHRWQRR